MDKDRDGSGTGTETGKLIATATWIGKRTSTWIHRQDTDTSTDTGKNTDR
jgi:hypothetical protein